MIDIHAHLNDNKLFDNVEIIIENAKNNGVNKIVCVGDDLESSKRAIALSEKYENTYAVIGVHPDMLECFNLELEKFLIQNANKPKVIAIGEIGLDYHSENYDKDLQKKCFIRQLEIAHKVNLPVEIHMRDATQDTMEILKTHKNLINNGGIIHCYSGSFETFEEFYKLGLCVSLGGIITFKNAKNTLELVKKLPIDAITLETDCPYLTPHPYRGEINEPKFVRITAAKIAEIKNLPLDEIDKITTQNAYRIFPKLR